MPSTLIPSTRVRAAALALSLLVLATTASSSRAAEQLWYGTFNNNWWNGGNWLGIAIPVPTDTVFFGHDFSILRSTVNLDANATIHDLDLDSHPPNNEYLFTRTGNSVLTVTENSIFRNTISTNFVNSVTMSGFHLNTTDLQILDFTRLNVQSNSHVLVTSILSIDPEAELSVTTGTFEMGFESRADVDGKWIIGQNTTLGHRTLIRVLQPTGLLSVNNGFNFSNASEVFINNGGDVVGNAFIDIGNTGSSTVSIRGAGSTWTAGGTSDWGRTSTGNAAVTLRDGAQATLFNLRMGEVNGTSFVTVTEGAFLTVDGAFSAGGGTSDRTVLLDAGNVFPQGNENFVTFNGTSTFNDKAVLDSNLNSTINFNQNATFNEGSRFDRSFGSTLNIASGKKLIINDGFYDDTINTGQTLSPGAGIEIRGAFGGFNVDNRFDIGTGSLLVELNGYYNSPDGAAVTKWAALASEVMTGALRSGGQVKIGDLHIAERGTANVTIESGGHLKPRNLTTGGQTGASANLFFDGGLATVAGNVNLGQGTFFTINDPLGDGLGQTGNVGIVGNLNLTGNAFLSTTGADPGLNMLGNLSTATGTQMQLGGNAFFGVGQSATLNGGEISLLGTTKMNVTDNLTLGVAGGGAGTLTVNLGTRLNVGDTAAAILDNNYSYVEDSSANAASGGTIFVRNGATLTNNNSGFSVGEKAGKSGRIVVSGAGSTVNDTTTYIGYAGLGTLNIDSGGKYVSEGAELGTAGGAAVVTIDGAGSRMKANRALRIEGGGSSITTTAGGAVQVGNSTSGPFATDRLIVGDSTANAAGHVIVSSGSRLNHHSVAHIAPNVNTFGTVVVTGANSRFDVGGILFLGFTGGSGDLQVLAGGRVGAALVDISGSTPASQSKITVSGPSSLLAVSDAIKVGNEGFGAINILNGGTVTSLNANAGLGETGSGAINIDGANSVLRSTSNLGLNRASSLTLTSGGSLAVGDGSGPIPNGITVADNDPISANAGGLLTIASGSTVATPGLVFLSRNSAHSGRLLVTGANSTLTADTVFVAERGRGDARIEAGGKINATGQFQVGSEAGGVGTAAITGAGSTVTTGGLTVGLFSEGDLEIENGGKAVTSFTNIGQFAGSAGAIAVSGANSRLEVANGLTVGNLGAGALNVQSGGVVAAANVTVNSVSSLNLSGSSVVQSSIDNSGLLSAFNSSVTGGVTLRANSQMSFDNATIGSLTQHASDLLVNLRGASDFDNLIVTGAASLGGDVEVSLSPGFSPTLGAQFPILTASSITGTPTFDFSQAPLANGLIWNVALSPTSLSLVVATPGIPGDFNGNGIVDGADFLLWQRGGSFNPLSSGDLALWKANYGASAMATHATDAVPEPHACLLGGIACVALWRRRGL